MKAQETIVGFHCEGHRIYGVLHRPEEPARRGVLVLGRVGGHRQSVLWARSWAASGIPVLRFDLRGRGDSEGPVVPIEETPADLRSAIDTFQARMPQVKEVVGWGISEGASVALLYAPTDTRVTGLVLCNPWLRAERAVARASLRQHLSRLASREFWAKIRRSQFGYWGAARSFARLVANYMAQGTDDTGAADGSKSLRDRLADSLRDFSGHTLIVLSGDDPAAEVFKTAAASSAHWPELLRTGRVTVRNLPGATHLFSSREWREQVGNWTCEWLQRW